MKKSSRSDQSIVTAQDQERRKKTGAKTNSTSEVMERREANTSANSISSHTITMLNEASPSIWTSSGRSKIAKNPFINSTHVAIKPRFYIIFFNSKEFEI